VVPNLNLNFLIKYFRFGTFENFWNIGILELLEFGGGKNSESSVVRFCDVSMYIR
jgi:hypothetical protein